MRYKDLLSEDGRIVKGVNTTVDVGVGQIPIEARKFGNTVDKDGRPPTLSKKVKGKSTNVLFNLGLAESKQQPCPRTKASSCQCESVNKITEAEEPVTAVCVLEHGDSVEGTILLKQQANGPTLIVGKITGLQPGEHGFHIHEFGDLSKGCESAGGHYNPDGVDHGDIDNGHVGDLGNIVADKSGTANISIVAKRVTLLGEKSVVGRAIVVHSDVDDLGQGGDDESLKTGNAGDRLACGVITLKETINEKWSAKYKRSINCNNPKGFSQRAHCQGRKKNESVTKQDLNAPTPTIQMLATKWQTSPKEILTQVKKGVKVEAEHTTNFDVAMEIALDHINEDPKYYDKLKKVEEADGLGEIASSSQIYVDMDGVLADFFGEWARLMDVEHYTQINKQHDINDALQKIRDTDDFWLRLPMLPEAKNLLNLIKQVKGNYNICSSPLADDPNSEKHKRTWIEQNLNFFPPDNVYITHDKAQYATNQDGTPNILIDDYGVNIRKWEAAGGIGFKYKDHKFERTADAIKQHMQEPVEENFADGKKKGKSRPGRVKRAGASCKGSVTSLRKRAKNASGEKAKMYHWCANMKSGRKK